MEKLSTWKKFKLYLSYKKIIKNNIDKLTDKKYNLRVDKVNRVYTVINLPDDVKTYGSNLSQKYIQEYINEIDKLFLEIGLSELVGIIDIKQIDETNYLIIFGFSFMNTAKLFNNIIIYSLIILILSTIYIIFF